MQKIQRAFSLRELFEYTVVRFFAAFVSLIPRRCALRFGACAGELLCRLGVYRKIVAHNMRHVGYWDESRREHIEKELYRNIGKYAVDFLRPCRKNCPVEIEGEALLAALQRKQKGILVLLAHCGNWELLARIFGTRVNRLHVVAKPMRNRRVERWLRKKREKTGVRVIYRDHALRSILNALKKNEVVAILIDQNPGQHHGTRAPFLGKPAYTIRTAAGVALKTGCGVIATHAIIQDDGSYRIVIFEVETKKEVEGEKREDAITRVQHTHNDIVSSIIQHYPEHYFGWFHRRFRGVLSYRNV
jgi:KDO2-lipid IV(A) lauroyltransferase